MTSLLPTWANIIFVKQNVNGPCFLVGPNVRPKKGPIWMGLFSIKSLLQKLLKKRYRYKAYVQWAVFWTGLKMRPKPGHRRSELGWVGVMSVRPMHSLMKWTFSCFSESKLSSGFVLLLCLVHLEENTKKKEEK